MCEQTDPVLALISKTDERFKQANILLIAHILFPSNLRHIRYFFNIFSALFNCKYVIIYTVYYYTRYNIILLQNYYYYILLHIFLI